MLFTSSGEKIINKKQVENCTSSVENEAYLRYNLFYKYSNFSAILLHFYGKCMNTKSITALCIKLNNKETTRLQLKLDVSRPWQHGISFN